MASTSTPIPVKIKHNGKVYDVQLDPLLSPAVFKTGIHNATGVPPDRQKVMIKGGMLKDDTDLRKLNVRPGQTFMVIGAAGSLPKAPTAPVTFLEDMDDTQLALATKTKSGLVNLGNTCYLNSTVQALRSVPELQVALNKHTAATGSSRDPSASLTASLRDLYRDLSTTTEGFPPLAFLHILRQVAPQFAEQVQGRYAQQDAEECWLQIVQSLQSSLVGLTSPEQEEGAAGSVQRRSFVEQYMMGEMETEMKTDEAPNEAPSVKQERFQLLHCNISVTTNEMTQGIKDSLNQTLEKDSATLNRSAVYNVHSRITRLPAYLTVHFVRFYWRRDINKKTKIMRKVKFPFDLDVLDFTADGLKEKLRPANEKIKKIEKERDERAKIRRRAKQRQEEQAAAPAAGRGSGGPAPMAVDTAAEETTTARDSSATPETTDKATSNKAGMVLTVEDEVKVRKDEVAEVAGALDPDLVRDLGANTSGLYELAAVVTHKGASADGGHYMAWVKKADDDVNEAGVLDKPAEEEWYKFDDDKVSIVPREKIMTLDGGGEDSTAYLLLYRSKTIK